MHQFVVKHSLSKRYRFYILTLMLGTLLGFGSFTQALPCSAQQPNCEFVTTGTQREPAILATVFDVAALGTIGIENAPSQPTNMQRGLGDEATQVSAYVPCVLLKAHGAVESAQDRGRLLFNGWKQFNTLPDRQGETLVNRRSGLCAYGIMQLVDGMNPGRPWPPSGTFSPQRAAGQASYNIASGAKLLVHKWNSISRIVGNNDPYIVEDWYFASWAYFGLTADDNPANPTFPPNRGSWQCAQDATQQSIDWPYQELVWGCARNPPLVTPGKTLWSPVPLTLPDRNLFINGIPTAIARPQPEHRSCELLHLPILRR